MMSTTDYDGIHTCNPDCPRPACIAVREAVAAEREACAKVCDDFLCDQGRMILAKTTGE